MMATKGSIPPKLYEISGLIPLTQTLFIWPTFWTAVALIIVSVLIAYFSAPNPERAKTVEDYGLKFDPIDTKPRAPAEARRVARVQPRPDHPRGRHPGVVPL